jgi:hypothetical protein
VESENRFVKLKLTAKGLRIVDKKGIDTVLTEIRANNASNLLKFSVSVKQKSLNLGFLVHYMLSYNWIKLFNFHLFWV